MNRDEQNINLERLVRETLRENLDRVDVPETSRILDGIRTKLNVKPLRKRAPIYWAAAVMIFIIITGFTAVLPITASYRERIISIIDLPNKPGAATRNIAIGHKSPSPQSQAEVARIQEPKIAGSPDKGVSVMELPPPEPKVMSLAEAQQQSPFYIRVPDYLPQGWNVSQLVYTQLSENSAQIIIEYKNQEAKRLLTLEQTNLTGDFGMGMGYDADSATKEDVDINGGKGVLISFKDKSSHLIWFENNIKYELFGPIPGEEAKKIALSLKTLVE